MSLSKARFYNTWLQPIITPLLSISVYYEIARNLNCLHAVVPLIDGHKADLFKNLNTTVDMEEVSSFNQKSFKNMILIAGDGRNVGKTFLSCKIIRHLSSHCNVIGIKISPHFHNHPNDETIVYKNDRIVIVDEKAITRKDSSLMLQAGAKRVFFIMSRQNDLEEAFSIISDQLLNHCIVCESGGLHDVLKPGLFLFVKSREEEIQKKHLLQYAPIIVTNRDNSFDFEESSIGYNNNQITLKLDIKD